MPYVQIECSKTGNFLGISDGTKIQIYDLSTLEPKFEITLGYLGISQFQFTYKKELFLLVPKVKKSKPKIILTPIDRVIVYNSSTEQAVNYISYSYGDVTHIYSNPFHPVFLVLLDDKEVCFQNMNKRKQEYKKIAMLNRSRMRQGFFPDGKKVFIL